MILRNQDNLKRYDELVLMQNLILDDQTLWLVHKYFRIFEEYHWKENGETRFTLQISSVQVPLHVHNLTFHRQIKNQTCSTHPYNLSFLGGDIIKIEEIIWKRTQNNINLARVHMAVFT